LRQLRQRISVRTTILPLTKGESLEYIQHRLKKAATNDALIFTKRAMRKIIRESQGIPRIINILCENALITGYGYQEKKIHAGIVKEVIVDLKGKKRPARLKWLLASLILLLLVLAYASFSASPYRDLVLSKVKAWLPIPTHRSPVITNRIGPLSDNDTDVSVTEAVVASSIEQPLTRIVSKGDTLSSLVEEIYGYSDQRLLEYVSKNNPNIKAIDKILIGQEIRFPLLEGERRQPAARVRGRGEGPMEKEESLTDE